MSKKLTQLAEKSIQLVAAVPNKNLLIHRSIEQLAQLEPAPTAISDTSTSTRGQILLANKGIFFFVRLFVLHFVFRNKNH